jgi:uncharacterized damage-inducible protein DinB
MIDPELLVTLYDNNVRILDKQLSTLNDEQAFTIVGGHNINWLTGHIVSGRQRVLERINIPHLWTPEQRAPYMNGTLPQEKEGPGVQRLEALLATLHQSQSLIEEGLPRMTQEQLSAPTEFPQDGSLAGRLLYLQYHETYHVGQIVLIAQTLGVPGAWLT